MLKLSKVASLLPMAEARVDQFFAARINVILGPMAALHARKRVLAQAGLIDDQSAILAKASEQDQTILAIDAERRAMKARIRAATSSIEIHAILAELG